MGDLETTIPRPQSARQRRRRRAIAAAHQVFQAKGYELSSLKEIADTAEITVPTLYNHFGSKQQLLAAVIDASLDEVRDRLEARGLPSHSRAADFLIEHQLQLQMTLIEVLSPQVWMDAHFYYYLNPEYSHSAHQMDRFFIEIIQHCLEEMEKRGLIRPNLELEPLATLIDLATYDVVRGVVPTGEISAADLRHGLNYRLRPLVQLMQP